LGRVLGCGVIAVVGVVIWVGAHLPAIQRLKFERRRPSDCRFDGSMLATRGEMPRQCLAEGSAALFAEAFIRSRIAGFIRITASIR